MWMRSTRSDHREYTSGRTRSGKQQADKAAVPSAAAKVTKSTKVKSAVEVVLAEEDHADHHDGKRYLIRWSGTDASDQAWK